jgi:FkbM family methyltransferase
MKHWLANQVASFVKLRGYKISREAFHQEHEIDLRLLLAERIEREKGNVSVVQIGANDGVTNDPINHLVTSRGWSLLAVEPLAPAFSRLTQTYRFAPNVQCVRCAIAERNGELTLYTVAPSPDSGPMDDHLASFSREVLMKHWRRIPNLENRIVTQSVRAVTLQTLLEEYNVDAIDLMQIDTEGFDFEIIKMVLAAGLTPPILAFEWEHLDKQTMWECRGLLIEAGYRWLVVKGDVVAGHESLFG